MRLELLQLQKEVNNANEKHVGVDVKEVLETSSSYRHDIPYQLW